MSVSKAIERLKGVPNVHFKRTELAPDAPAPRTNAMIAVEGSERFQSALKAWDKRLAGVPIVDIAHEAGISIESARVLLKEAHQAIAEDLKDALEQNRALDLARIDGLLASYYPVAKEGDSKAALVILKCLQHRATLTGITPERPSQIAHSNQPTNILVWIQQQLPEISRIVDALPKELPP
jgi:hypothetical protein